MQLQAVALQIPIRLGSGTEKRGQRSVVANLFATLRVIFTVQFLTADLYMGRDDRLVVPIKHLLDATYGAGSNFR
jgi:hypothetical protein